jgi:OOP family OmpA-OmpF porin
VADDMANYLISQNPGRVTIIGHTDSRGTTAHNQGLSERRARAVADFLRARGFIGQIVTVGRGEGEPFQADDPARYTQAEHWRMDRRVELIR